MFKKIILTCALLCAGLSFAQFPAMDFEIGNTYVLGGDQYPYVLTRANIAIGPEILGSTVFVLPELGVFFKEETSYWIRTQLLLDGPTNTLFVDAQTSPMLGTQARVGIRFGF